MTSKSSFKTTSDNYLQVGLDVSDSKMRKFKTDQNLQDNLFSGTKMVEFVKRPTGKIMAIVDGYSYYCANNFMTTQGWRCTKAGLCKARFSLDKTSGIMIKSCLYHNHSAPSYVISNGVFIKC
jgi:hypothetical protein